MPRLSRTLPIFAALSLAAAAGVPSEAKACGGGTFYPTVEQTVATTGHRVIISLSKAQTVLWDQIDFKGDPQDFAWVYPIKQGAVLQLSNSAWTEALDAGTGTVVRPPYVDCGGHGGGCSLGFGAGAANDGSLKGDDGVQVVHRENVGPYDTVTISSKVPGAIGKWLTDNGYGVPADAKPILDDYEKQGFDFIAMRLAPGKGIGEMKPVRVVTPGMSTSFPMKMLSAGAGDKVALNIVVFAEGRMEAANFVSSTMSPLDVTWDFDASTSDYDLARNQTLLHENGTLFLTTYATSAQTIPDDLLNHWGGGRKIAATYFKQLGVTGEGSCSSSFGETLGQNDFANPDDPASNRTVVNLCDDKGTCASPGPAQIDARVFNCGKGDDLGVALTGMHPRDVWVTRLEANLPKAALAKDLVLQPAAASGDVDGYLEAAKQKGTACPSGAATSSNSGSRSGGKPPLPPSALGAIAAAALLVLATARRLARLTSPQRT